MQGRVRSSLTPGQLFTLVILTLSVAEGEESGCSRLIRIPRRLARVQRNGDSKGGDLSTAL